jgi:hypothetical protein
MAEITRLEKIADKYIEDYLKDHPINDFSLETDLEEYTENIEGKSEILQEYLKSERSRTIEAEADIKSRNTLDSKPGLSDVLLEIYNLFVLIIDSLAS